MGSINLKTFIEAFASTVEYYFLVAKCWDTWRQMQPDDQGLSKKQSLISFIEQSQSVLALIGQSEKNPNVYNALNQWQIKQLKEIEESLLLNQDIFKVPLDGFDQLSKSLMINHGLQEQSRQQCADLLDYAKNPQSILDNVHESYLMELLDSLDAVIETPLPKELSAFWITSCCQRQESAADNIYIYIYMQGAQYFNEKTSLTHGIHGALVIKQWRIIWQFDLRQVDMKKPVFSLSFYANGLLERNPMWGASVYHWRQDGSIAQLNFYFLGIAGLSHLPSEFKFYQGTVIEQVQSSLYVDNYTQQQSTSLMYNIMPWASAIENSWPKHCFYYDQTFEPNLASPMLWETVGLKTKRENDWMQKFQQFFCLPPNVAACENLMFHGVNFLYIGRKLFLNESYVAYDQMYAFVNRSDLNQAQRWLGMFIDFNHKKICSFRRWYFDQMNFDISDKLKEIEQSNDDKKNKLAILINQLKYNLDEVCVYEAMQQSGSDTQMAQYMEDFSEPLAQWIQKNDLSVYLKCQEKFALSYFLSPVQSNYERVLKNENKYTLIEENEQIALKELGRLTIEMDTLADSDFLAYQQQIQLAKSTESVNATVEKINEDKRIWQKVVRKITNIFSNKKINKVITIRDLGDFAYVWYFNGKQLDKKEFNAFKQWLILTIEQLYVYEKQLIEEQTSRNLVPSELLSEQEEKPKKLIGAL